MNIESLPDIQRLIGIAGVAFYLASYFALQMGLVRGDGFLYPGLNVVAAALVLFDLGHSFNLPSALIQVSRIAISTIDIARLALLRWGRRAQSVAATSTPSTSRTIRSMRCASASLWVATRAPRS